MAIWNKSSIRPQVGDGGGCGGSQMSDAVQASVDMDSITAGRDSIAPSIAETKLVKLIG